MGCGAARFAAVLPGHRPVSPQPSTPLFESLTQALQTVFSRWGKDRQLTAANIQQGLEEIRTALLDADVHYQVARDLVARVTERAVGQEVIQSVRPAEQIIKLFQDVLTEAMQGEPPRVPPAGERPVVVMMVGLQGSGKTTTSAKLAQRLRKQGRRPLLVAADVRRPAAVHQLQVLGQRLGIPVHAEEALAPPLICERGVEAARRNGQDVVILDTAGRLHIDQALMQELVEVAQRCPPDVVYLVCDAMAGQDAYGSAREFQGRLRLDALILTKLDGDTRGGAAISVKSVTGKPIAFLGTGETLEDLDEFHADRMASRILGMGDVVSLVEKAQAAMDEDEAEEAAERLLKAQFTFHDFLGQLKAIRRMGPLSHILKLLPGGLGQAFGQSGVDEGELKKVEAVILSMTEDERNHPDRIDASRKRRIARGSGTEVALVNQLLRQFVHLRGMMKAFSGGGMLSRLTGRGAPAMPGGPGTPSASGLTGSRERLEALERLQRPAAAAIDREALRKERKRQKQARKRNRRR